MKRLIVSFFIIVCWTVTAWAINVEKGKEIVNNIGREALDVLTPLDPKDPTWYQEFVRIFKKSFDELKISSVVLGPAWKQFDEGQRARFLAVLPKQLSGMYAGKFPAYRGATFKVTGARTSGGRGVVIVASILQKGNDPVIHIEWYLTPQGKIYDMVGEGLSPTTTLRSEYHSVLNQNGNNVEAFLLAIETRH